MELFVTSSFTECHHRPQWALLFGCGVVVSSSSPFFLFRVSASSFQSLRSPALCSVSLSLFCFTYHSTSVSVFPYIISLSIHFYLPRSRYYTFFSLSLHMAQPSQSHVSYFLTYVAHTCPYAFISSFLTFSILFIPIIHFNILISDICSKFCSTIPSAQISFSYIKTGLMTVLYGCFEHNGRPLVAHCS